MNEEIASTTTLRKRWIVFAVLLAVALAAVGGWWLLAPKPPANLEEALPADVQGLAKTRVRVGAEAMAATSRMHVGTVTPAADAVIGFYEQNLVIWLTRYKDRRLALVETEKMVKGMRTFGRGFQELDKVKMGVSEVYLTFPGGQAQYFWTSRDVIAYVTPGPMSEAEVSRLVSELDSQISRLPPLPQTR